MQYTFGPIQNPLSESEIKIKLDIEFYEKLNKFSREYMSNTNDIHWKFIKDSIISNKNLLYENGKIIESELKNIFMSDINFTDTEITYRPEKHIDRIIEKSEKYCAFKTINDIIGYRISSTAEKISSKCKVIDKYISKKNGISNNNNIYSDIIKTFYSYIPNIGIVEFQVGHPFAFYANDICSSVFCMFKFYNHII